MKEEGPKSPGVKSEPGGKGSAPPEEEPVEVECRSGCKACERPVAFLWQGSRRSVKAVTRSWIEAGVRPGEGPVECFRVETIEGEAFALRYDRFRDVWSAATVDAPPPRPLRPHRGTGP